MNRLAFGSFFRGPKTAALCLWFIITILRRGNHTACHYVEQITTYLYIHKWSELIRYLWYPICDSPLRHLFINWQIDETNKRQVNLSLYFITLFLIVVQKVTNNIIYGKAKLRLILIFFAWSLHWWLWFEIIKNLNQTVRVWPQTASVHRWRNASQKTPNNITLNGHYVWTYTI